VRGPPNLSGGPGGIFYRAVRVVFFKKTQKKILCPWAFFFLGGGPPAGRKKKTGGRGDGEPFWAVAPTPPMGVTTEVAAPQNPGGPGEKKTRGGKRAEGQRRHQALYDKFFFFWVPRAPPSTTRWAAQLLRGGAGLSRFFHCSPPFAFQA